MFNQTTAPAPGTRFRLSIEDLRRFLWQVASLQPLLAPLLMLVWGRLHRTLLRLDSLATRWHQSRLHPARPRARPRARRIPPPADPSNPTRAPQGHAWLIRLHQPIAQFIPRIELLVNDPEIIALCAAALQAGRILRPLGRMFALPVPAHIHRPPAPRKPRPKKPDTPKPPPFAEHSPAQWPFVPRHLRLRVPGLPSTPGRRRRKPPD